MISANVAKNNNTAINLVPLEPSEREKLSASLLGWGKLKAAKEATGLAGITLKQAVLGGKLKPINAEKIRTFLNSL